MMDDRSRIKMMVDKLADQCARGCIENDWEETFIFDMQKRLAGPYGPTDKQIAIIERLFERY